MTPSSILVVGSNTHFGYLMQRFISQSAHHASFAYPGAPALAVIQREKPAAIILEISSPGMEGAILLHTLKTDPATCHIPVVICSWHDEQDPREAIADAYLRMPILYEEFIKALTQIGI